MIVTVKIQNFRSFFFRISSLKVFTFSLLRPVDFTPSGVEICPFYLVISPVLLVSCGHVRSFLIPFGHFEIKFGLDFLLTLLVNIPVILMVCSCLSLCSMKSFSIIKNRFDDGHTDWPVASINSCSLGLSCVHSRVGFPM